MSFLDGMPDFIRNSGEAKRMRGEAVRPRVVPARPAGGDIGIEAMKALRGKDAAREFLRLFGGEDALLLVLDPAGKAGPVALRGAGLLDKAQALNDQKRGIYYHLNLPADGLVKKATKADIIGVGAIGFDFDYPDTGGVADAARAILQAKITELETGPLPPSIILSSGGGIQALWLLDCEQPMPATPEMVAMFEGIGKAVRARHGGDDVSNIDRVMRVPGFTNWPTAAKAARGQMPAEAIVLGGTGTMYALDVLAQAFPPTEAKAAAPATPWVSRGAFTDVNAELRAGIGRAVDLDEVRDAALFIVRSRPPGYYGSGQYERWSKDLALPLAAIAAEEPAQEGDVRALLDELVLETGRKQQDNQRRFSTDLANTKRRAAAGGKLLGRGTLFEVAGAVGWLPATTGPQSAAQPAEGGQQRIASGEASPGTPTATSGPRLGSAGAVDGPVDIFNPPINVPIPLAVLPAGLRDFIKVKAQALGCDGTALAYSVLTVCAAAIDARTTVLLSASDWWQRPILRALLIGDPSTMKSPIITAATAPLVELDTAASLKLEAERSAWRALKAAKSGPVPPRPDLPAQFTVNDVTHQKACEILSRKPRGALMIRDEMSGLFASCVRETDDRSFWLLSWDATYPHRKQKAGNGRDDQESDIFVEVPALSMIGGIQPGTLKNFKLTDDGLLQRFLPIHLAPPVEADYDADTAAEAAHYGKLVKTIATHGTYGTIRLSPEAKKVRDGVMKYLREIERNIAAGGNGSALASAIAKTRGLWGRLALVLHIVEFEDARLQYPEAVPPPFPTEISEDIARRADELSGWVVRVLLVHYFNRGKFSEETKAIASIILRKKLLKITSREVMRSVHKLSDKTAKDVADAMSRLVAAGWATPVAPVKGITTVTAWDIDPAVHALFADIARQEEERVATTKELMRDSFAAVRQQRANAAPP